ncbi:16529_t:CDS:2, partial [Cetraspora pellucida]
SVVQERSFYAFLHPQTCIMSNNNMVYQSETKKLTSTTKVVINEITSFAQDSNNSEKLDLIGSSQDSNSNEESYHIGSVQDSNSSEKSDHIELVTNFFCKVENDIKQNMQLFLAFEKFQKGYCNTKIPVQAASVQRKKRVTNKHSSDKENEDPHKMQLRKKRKS